MENDANTVEVQDEIKEEQIEEVQEVLKEESSELSDEEIMNNLGKLRRLASKKGLIKAPKPQAKITNPDREFPKPSDILRADEFKLHRLGYTEDEIDIIMQNGGMKIIQDEKHPLTLGLKTAREQRKAEQAASETDSKSGLSEIERKYSNEDLQKMKPEDLEKLIGFAN